MASAFLSSILSKTSQLVLDSVRRLAVSPSSSSDPRSSVLEDLKKMERTLKRIQAVLHDAEEREIRDKAVKLWLEELKEVAYDAEDVLDEYHYEELRAQAEGGASRKRKRVEGEDGEEVSGSLSTIVVSIPDGMGDRIREIMERFDEISEGRERLHLREGDGERRVLEDPYPAPTSHMVDESCTFGRDHEKQVIIDLLLSEGMGNGISVIPIVGKGGLGKTTIARLVYNDSKVKEHFDLTGWVCVSDDFDVTRLTKAIIESLTRKSCDLTQLSTLQDTLKEQVKGKKVLLVLDDVWNEQQSLWESLRKPFVCTETAARIIMTCRDDLVAQIMQTVPPYRPGCLSPEQSWSLFRQYAFGEYAFGGRDPEEQSRLEDIGKQIIKKCSGLPLAVKSIGSLLRHERDEDGWMEVLQSDLWELDENNETLASLRLSYIRMPAHLKPCFVYCCTFPKDHVFDKDYLVRLWMAQGYIPPGGRRRMEDIGDEYFKGLQRRSFFDSYYWFKFKMHDMIHDLAKSIAGHGCYTIMDNKLPGSPDKVRHLYVGNQVESVKLCDPGALRSLLVGDLYRQPLIFPEMIQWKLRCLRVLQFHWNAGDEIPDFLGNLKHLRYLCISSPCIKSLPESVCLLYHLQTLILNCYMVKELPSGIGSLTKLRNIDITGTRISYLPAGIGKLTNLQSLRAHHKVQRGIGVLKDLVNLQGDLCISGLRNVVNIEDAGLKHKHELRSLFLYWNAVTYKGVGPKDWFDEEDGRLLHVEAFPEENKDVPTDEKREEAMVEYLQPHANLKKLVINGYGGSKFPKWMGNPFPLASLGEIHIIDCEKVRSLSLYIHDPLGRLDAPMSKSVLERVYVSGCRQLTSIAGLHHLHSLRTLKIYNCPQLQHLSKEGLPSDLKNLYIEKCQQLISLSGMQNLTSLGASSIKKGGLPSKLENLYIEECQQLTSLPGMQNLTSLRALTIKNCPQLQHLSEKELTSKLENLHIEECQQLTSLPGMQNLTSLRALTIKNCPQLQHLSKEGLPSKLENLHIEECQQLTSLPGMQNLASLRALTIKNCPQLQHLSEKELPSKLENLHIEECQQLTSLPGMQNLTSLRALTIKNCPQLQHLSKEGLPSKLENLHIEECQQLTSLPGMQNLTSLQALTIKNCPQLQHLSEEGLPSKLENLHIEECQQLRSLPGVQNLISLGALTIKNCPQLQHLSKEGLPSNLKNLHIEECQQLTSLPGMQNLTSLGALTIKNCPQLRHLSEEGLPSKLENLHIEECQQLTSLPGVQNLTSLGALTIMDCPKLQIMAEDQLSSMPEHVEIVDCPGLVNWCQKQKFNCIQVTSGNKLTISNTWENIKQWFDDLTSIEHFCFSTSWKFFLETVSISVLEELTAWGCTHIPPLEYLSKLTSLRRFIIKDCPGIQFRPHQLLPSTLKSFVVDGCEDLRYLLLAVENRDALEELQLVNCPKLEWAFGLNCLFFPKILRIEQCPQLQVCAEETENNGKIDGTQEKQVSNCVMIEHANNAVSPISDAKDDCEMGQFLRLGLPSGCSSQSPEQITAEPSERATSLTVERVSESSASKEINCIETQMFTELVGPDHYGRVRGSGVGDTLTQLFAMSRYTLDTGGSSSATDVRRLEAQIETIRQSYEIEIRSLRTQVEHNTSLLRMFVPSQERATSLAVEHVGKLLASKKTNCIETQMFTKLIGPEHYAPTQLFEMSRYIQDAGESSSTTDVRMLEAQIEAMRQSYETKIWSLRTQVEHNTSLLQMLVSSQVPSSFTSCRDDDDHAP